MNLDSLRVAFDEQVRRNTTTLLPGVAGFRDTGDVVWELAVPGQRRSSVDWSDLDGASADGAIAGQVEFFRRRGEVFEWQLLGYDQPAEPADPAEHAFEPVTATTTYVWTPDAPAA
jgi:hypothetical protein